MAAVGLSVPVTASSGALAAYILSECQGVLELSRRTALAAPFAEVGLMDVEILGALCSGALVGRDVERQNDALGKLRAVVRSTTAYKERTASIPTAIEELRTLCAPLALALAATGAERLRIVRTAATRAAEAACAPVPTAPVVGVGDLLGAGAAAAQLEALQSTMSAMDATMKAVKRLAAGGAGAGASAVGPDGVPVAPKGPTPKVIFELVTANIEAQIGQLPPTILMSIEEDVARAHAKLTSTPPRAAALDTLELPLGGRSQDTHATRPRTFTHARGESAEAEMALLERWLMVHAAAGASPAGPQYHLGSGDEVLAVSMSRTDALVVHSRVVLAPAADDGADAASTDGDGGAGAGGGTDDGDGDGLADVALVANFVAVQLFASQCRAEAATLGLSASEAQAFADDVRSEVDNVLFKRHRTLTAIATGMASVDPHALAKSSVRADAAPSRGRVANSAAPRDASASGAKRGGASSPVCHRWLTGACQDDDCKYRHWLTSGEKAKATSRDSGGRDHDKDRDDEGRDNGGKKRRFSGKRGRK